MAQEEGCSVNYHDLLARLGEGSAHPGGFMATMQLVERYPLPQGSRVLEIGCGTGRTSCHLARCGYQVTAVDSNESMLKRAERRIAREEAKVKLVRGDAEQLPFPDGIFDLVFVESVSIFTDARSALAEYRRVLKPGGTLLDRELTVSKESTALMKGAMRQLYGMRTMADEQGWLEMMRLAGFTHYSSEDVRPEIMVTLDDVDPNREVDPTLFFDEAAFYLGQMNARILERYRTKLGSAVFVARA